MRAWLVFIIVLFISVRTLMYGIWIVRNKNVAGGIYVFLLACGALGMAARYVFKY